MKKQEIYGYETLDDIHNSLKVKAQEYNYEIDFYQSNYEGDIVCRLQEAYKKYDYLIINPAAFTHYSIAIRDAVLLSELKTIEVHLSNIHKREEFRHKSLISDIAVGVICGLGSFGYSAALEYIRSSNK